MGCGENTMAGIRTLNFGMLHNTATDESRACLHWSDLPCVFHDTIRGKLHYRGNNYEFAHMINNRTPLTPMMAFM